MFTISVEKKCGCFTRSGLKGEASFNDKNEALSEAVAMVETMNTTFCKKHSFQVVENGSVFQIVEKVENQG